jgi:hypothetical protein
LSYEQIEISESPEHTNHVLGKDSSNLQPYLNKPRRTEFPLSSLGDIKKSVHTRSATSIPGDKVEYFHTEGRGLGGIVTAFGNGASGTIQLQGRTDASFDSTTYKTTGVTLKDADGCACTEGKCVRAKGVLQANYVVHTKVTLPKVSDYPDLDDEQKKRFQDAVTNILAPHEQQHVAAFRKYNGNTSRPFDITACKNNLDSEFKAMFDAEEGPRQQAAKNESDQLDPFYFEFKL